MESANQLAKNYGPAHKASLKITAQSPISQSDLSQRGIRKKVRSQGKARHGALRCRLTYTARFCEAWRHSLHRINRVRFVSIHTMLNYSSMISYSYSSENLQFYEDNFYVRPALGNKPRCRTPPRNKLTYRRLPDQISVNEEWRDSCAWSWKFWFKTVTELSIELKILF